MYEGDIKMKHPSIVYAADIKSLCEPLAMIDITTFSHLRIDDKNQMAALCNNPEFLLNYIARKYYTADPCINFKPESVDFGEYIIWDAVDCSGRTAEMLADAAEFDFKHTFTIVKKKRGFTDVYHFGTALSNPSIYQIYINNLDILDRFITFFNANIKQSKVLKRAYNIIINPHQAASNVELDDPDDLLFKTQETRQAILKALIPPDETILSKTEIKCAQLVLAGKTAKEIANLLGCSYRTIEDRLRSLKKKLEAKNKTDLIVKLLSKKYLI
jgi:DNA-binding CsgD family transcriptional regulator